MPGIFDKIKKFMALENEEYDSENGSFIDYEDEGYPRKILKPRATLISLPSPRKQEIVILEPINLDEARQVADQLNLKKSVIVNVRKADKEMSKRIVDFLSGICYALDGHVQLIADNIFVFTPASVGIIMGSKRDNSSREKEE